MFCLVSWNNFWLRRSKYYSETLVHITELTDVKFPKEPAVSTLSVGRNLKMEAAGSFETLVSIYESHMSSHSRTPSHLFREETV
jgi:hypothetical protein